MEAKTKRGGELRTGIVVGLCSAAFFIAAGVAIGFMAAKRPDPLVVQDTLKSYVEGMAKAGKIVLVEARQRLELRETTPGLLFGDSAIGRFLGIRSDATVEASAWADLSFVVDLNSTEGWSARYVPVDGGSLSFAAPPLSMLTPAVHTDTIRIQTTDRSILLDESRLEEVALRGLTARFVESASSMLDDPELRSKASAALEAILRAFAVKGAIPVARVDIAFAPPED
ncbi:MAG: hypothetical protein CVV51_00685 [Spirochaetae bacterium HGW-Spirochaetae-7]|nr:MAG: hypothetical protein CVV51_00685 [Spirochaetae bacterium HGW-Spirochaetae-7]